MAFDGAATSTCNLRHRIGNGNGGGGGKMANKDFHGGDGGGGGYYYKAIGKASCLSWTVEDVVHVARHHWIPCVFAMGLLFFMGVEYTLRMVPAASPPFDLGFVITRPIHRVLSSWPELNTLLAALNTPPRFAPSIFLCLLLPHRDTAAGHPSSSSPRRSRWKLLQPPEASASFSSSFLPSSPEEAKELANAGSSFSFLAGRPFPPSSSPSSTLDRAGSALFCLIGGHRNPERIRFARSESSRAVLESHAPPHARPRAAVHRRTLRPRAAALRTAVHDLDFKWVEFGELRASIRIGAILNLGIICYA